MNQEAFDAGGFANYPGSAEVKSVYSGPWTTRCLNDVCRIRCVWSVSPAHADPPNPSDFPPEHVDTNELSKRGIRVGYTPDVLTEAGTSNPSDTTAPQ